jgi:hypothetical protein
LRANLSRRALAIADLDGDLDGDATSDLIVADELSQLVSVLLARCN